MNRLQQFLVSRFWDRTHAAGEYTTWPQEEVVRLRLNQRITGSPHEWPMEWFARSVVTQPFRRAVSLACGEGALERDLMAKGLAEAVTGLDISERSLELARQRAAEAGYTNLHYEGGDLDALQLEAGSFDAAFAHMALHHVRNLESCFDQLRSALNPNGIFYLEEYVGPSRHEWKRELLEAAEDAYADLPKAIRGRRRLTLPVDWRDPSEAVRSAEILPLLAERFDIRERRDYGGNLLSLIYPHLRLEGLEPQAREATLEQLLAREDELLTEGVASFYTVVVAAPR
ncbi:MAG: class I SAM-dependent methyltransferase [Acidobacteriota bacterium]